jgi:hypothetical protein
MLLPYTADEPIFFGFRMNPILKQGYMGENAGNFFLKGQNGIAVNFCRDRVEPWGAQGTRPESF